MVDQKLNIYSGKGIGTEPEIEIVKRLNYIQEPLECTPLQDEIIPAKGVKSIKIKVWLPIHWTNENRLAAIGLPIIIHSEDLENNIGIDQLQF